MGHPRLSYIIGSFFLSQYESRDYEWICAPIVKYCGSDAYDIPMVPESIAEIPNKAGESRL
jgi:hypothetical protein